MEKKPKLTKKQRGFVKDYVETGNATQAVKNHYDVSNDLTARVIGSENLTKPNVALAIDIEQKSLKDALEDQGITAARIASKVDELLEAKNGDEPNYQAIDKGITHAIKIRGDYSDEPPKPASTSTYNFLFSAETQADVAAIEAKIKARLTQPHESQQGESA